MMKFPHEEGKSGMSLKKYEAFVRTVELGSLTRAAEAMGSTQSRISHVLSALEEEYGFVLLRRNRSGVRLTEAGAMVLPKMQEILQKDRELTELVEDIRSADAGTVRLGAFTSVAVHWLPGLMQDFQTLYPHVEFKLFNGDYHDVDRWLTDGSVDIGFITLPTALRCECIPLREDRLLAILPENHPLAKKDVCPVKEVAALPFISLLESSDDDARRALDAAGVKPNVRFTTKDDYAILAMVSQGLGVSIVPELLLQGHRDGIAVREMTPPSSRTIALAVPAGGRAGPATRRFARFAEEWVKKNDPQKL